MDVFFLRGDIISSEGGKMVKIIILLGARQDWASTSADKIAPWHDPKALPS